MSVDIHEQTVNETRLVLLGTGTPNAEPDRSGPATAVVVGGVPYLVDFGPGVVRQSNLAYERGITALNPVNLNCAFLTHLHSDHTAGYPDLILTPWVLGRDRPLEVYGPTGLVHLTHHILKAYRADIDGRMESVQPSNDSGWRVNANEITGDGVVYDDAEVRVKAFGVAHGSFKSYGYRFITADRDIVISSDTTPCDTLVEEAKGCDILVHEVYSVAGFETLPPEWKRYHRTHHTSTRELADIASRIEPGLLVLQHQLLWGSTGEELLAEIREEYKGEVVYGSDLDVY